MWAYSNIKSEKRISYMNEVSDAALSKAVFEHEIKVI